MSRKRYVIFFYYFSRKVIKRGSFAGKRTKACERAVLLRFASLQQRAASSERKEKKLTLFKIFAII
nr:MAG TPA: hypothetical protein [Caudoviricetes sp.]